MGKQAKKKGKSKPTTAVLPPDAIRRAYVTIYTVGGLNLLFGVGTYLGWGFAQHADLGIGWWSILTGLLLLGIGYQSQAQYRLTTLWLATLVWAADAILCSGIVVTQGFTPNWLMTAARLLFLWSMIAGLAPLKKWMAPPTGQTE